METSTLITLAVIGLALLIGGAIAVRLLLPKLIHWNELRKMLEEEKLEFDVKAELLENAEVVELLAPAAVHQVPLDRESDKKPHQQQAWLSPYPQAVSAANKRHKNELKKRAFLTRTRKQVAAAASMVSIEILPEGIQPANAGPEHFFITFKLQGLTEQKVNGLAPQIKAQLGLHSLVQTTAPNFRTVRYEAHAVEPIDRLTTEKMGVEFFEANPISKPTSVPLAITSDGKVWGLPLHHTLILGMTGSGKGSPMQGLIRQMTPLVRDGRAKLYGIDPKNIELKVYRKSNLFEKLVLGQTEDRIQDAMALIEHVFDLMMERAETSDVDLENANLARSMSATKETPNIVLGIDELLSLLIALLGMGKDGKRALTLLTTILAQGRSMGIYVVAATQEADKELLGRMRNNFANVIVLRQPSAYFNDLFLGEGAAAAGYDSTKIAPANPDNEYATAGIGFVKGETGEPVRVRFAFSSDRDISNLVIANLKHAAPPASTAAPSNLPVAPASPTNDETELEIEDDWDFSEVADGDDTDDDNALPTIN
jgi:hypothetical protein